MTTPDTNTSIDGEKSDGFLTEPDKDPENQSTNSQVDAEKDAASDSPAPLQSAHDTTPAAAPMSLLQTATLMVALCLCVFVAAMDVTIVTTALPTISGHFHTVAGYTWVGAAYTLGQAASTPVWGKLSDIWGRKPLLQIAIAVFFVGSVLSATSVSIVMLIVGRAVQGLGSGGLQTLVNMVIGDLFSMRERGKYYGFVGMTWAVALSIGPVIGGVLTEKVSWRWCFYINLPITGTVSVLILFLLKLDTPRTPMWDGLKAVDWLGALTIVGSSVMFLLGLEFGGVTFPWNSATVICLVVFGLVMAGAFAVIEWKVARYPVIPLRLFGSASNAASLGAAFIHGISFVTASFYLPLYFQGVLGATALLSGVWLLPYAGAMGLSASATGILIQRTGRYLEIIWFGFTLMTLGYGLFIDLDGTKNWPKMIIYQILLGLGVGPNFQAVLIALQRGVSSRDVGGATVAFGFMRNLASSIGVVIGGVIFQNGVVSHATVLTDSLGATAGQFLEAAIASTAVVDQLPEPQRSIVRAVYYESLRNVWIFSTSISAVGLFVLLAIRKSTLSREHQVVKTGLAAEEERRRAASGK